ncbi:unnamed protein product [Oreochromis niloticus]|nr:unnamed protein product [Mustela putorius furo]
MSAVTASLFSTLLFVGVFLFDSADLKTITAESGQDVTLTCRAPNNNIRITKWSRADLEPQYVLLFRDGHFDPANQHPSFKNRVDLQDRQMKDGDVSLILKNVTTTDYGTYGCGLFIEETRSWDHRTIHLHVVPPGQTGGQEKDGSVGTIVGLSVSAVILVAAVFFIYTRHCKQGQRPYQLPVC